MSNVPTPLVAILNGGAVNAGLTTTTITARLGAEGQTPEAQAAAGRFASWLSDAFDMWSTTNLVMNVMGQGPVPSFVPPFSPGGPVLGGTAAGVNILVGPGLLAF
jgi:hypothetical protein